MASLTVSETLPQSSAEAIRDFNERYLTVISVQEPSSWVDRFIFPVTSPLTTFPISLMSTKFHETIELSSRFKKMKEQTFDLSVVEYDAGYEAYLLHLKTNAWAYRNWQAVPQRFRIGEKRHLARALSTLLNAGTSTLSPWDGVNFFSTAHKSNPENAAAGTWGNYQSVAVDLNPMSIDPIVAEIIAMQGAVKDENGDSMMADPDEIWLPTDIYTLVSNKLNQAFLANGESNPMAGKIRPVHVPELPSGAFYLVDTKLMSMGIDPMLAATYVPADSLGLRYWDESSDFFKDTSKIKVSQHIWNGVKLVFPHAIRRVAYSLA
jgi:hypothetical protein